MASLHAPQAPTASRAPHAAPLVRAIGRWSLVAVVINSVIGSGVFGLPSTVAGLVGTASPLAVLAAGACIFLVVLAFGEVGSRFDQAGGPYLYTREAFGPAVGFQVGWLHVWTRLLSGAAVLNVLVSYLSALLPWAGTPVGRATVMIVAVVLVTLVNVIGVRQAAWAVNVFTVAKLLPLILLAVLGLFAFSGDVAATQAVPAPQWTDAILLLVFAYGGFESSIIAASETRDPKRDTAFALVVGMAAITLLYCLVQLAVIGVLPDAANSKTPVTSALAQVIGGAGATVGALAVVVSVYGWLTGFALVTPRIIYSMAERGELPALFGRVHERFRTPHVAVIANSAVALAAGLYSSFGQAATTSAIVRLGIFAATAAALIALRRRSGPAPFSLPGGPVIAVAGIAFCAWMITTRSFAEAWPLLIIVALGAMLWLTRARGARS